MQCTKGTATPAIRQMPSFDGKLWFSRGFRSSAASSRNATASSYLNSSWIQRLILPSQMTRFEESHDIKDMRIDLKTSTQMANQCDTPVYENSRTSKLDFYSSPFAVVAADRYLAALNAATSRSCEDREVLPFSQREVRVVPKPLPTVEALLPSFSQKVDERPTLPENGKLRTLLESTGLSNEVKQIVHFSADKTPRVSCSSIKGLDFASTNRARTQSLRAGTEGFTMSKRAPTSSGTEFSCSSNSCSGYMYLPIKARVMAVESAATERRHPFRCQDSNFSAEKGAEIKSPYEPTMPCARKRSKPASFARFPSAHACCGTVGNKDFATSMNERKKQQNQPEISVSFDNQVGNLFSCPLEHVKGVRERQSGFPASGLMKNSSLSGPRLEKPNAAIAKATTLENRHITMEKGSEKESWRIAQLAKELKECKQDVVDMGTRLETSPEPAEQSFYCKGEVADFKSAKKVFSSALLGQTNMDAGAGADADGHGKKEQEFDKLLQGVHCAAKTESDNKMNCTKEMEVKHLRALGRTSNWNNWMEYKSCIGGTVAASECSGSVALAGPSKPYSGGLDKASSSSCSNSPEEIGDGILSASKEERWLPDGHLLPSVLGKRYRDHDRQIDVAPEEKSVVKLELWMQRWFTAFQRRDLQGRPNVKREFKSFAGILPFFKGDDAKTGSTDLGPENFALLKRICHESSQYASKKKVPYGFPSATQSGQCRSSETSSHFLTPSAAAMAIMGTTARQVHDTQPQRKGLSDMWAAPKPSTSRIPKAQAETCKDFKTMSKPVKESLPVASAKPLAPVDV